MSARQTARWSILAGSVLLGTVVAMALCSLVWTPFDPERAGDAPKLLPPGWPHLLGTDRLGIDILSSIMAGARITLLVGVVAVGIAVAIGVPLGVLAAVGREGGRFGWGDRTGWIDAVISRGNDVMLAFPALLLAIILAAAFGSGTVTAMIAVGLGSAPAFARVARAATLAMASREFIVAARAGGRRVAEIVVMHVLPNIAGLVVVQASVSFGLAVLAEAALSYLGLGTPPPVASWGRMVQEAQGYLYSDPLQVLWPAIAIAGCVLGCNLIGDGLRDRLDPRLEGVR